jgi:hypothetical protein
MFQGYKLIQIDKTFTRRCAHAPKLYLTSYLIAYLIGDVAWSGTPDANTKVVQLTFTRNNMLLC